MQRQLGDFRLVSQNLASQMHEMSRNFYPLLTETMKVSFLSADKSTTSSCITGRRRMKISRGSSTQILPDDDNNDDDSRRPGR